MSHPSSRLATLLPAPAAGPLKRTRPAPVFAPVLALMICLLISSAASGQATREITQRMRASEDPSAFSGEIQGFVDAQVQRLMGEEPQAIGQARDALVSPVAQQDASRAFRDFYSQTLIARLDRALGQNPRHLNRLNIAIVTERVARNTRSTRFMPLAARLTGDESAAVALWGIKTGYWVLPESFEAGGAQRHNFVPAVVAAVSRFPDNGILAIEAYNTLSLRVAVPAHQPPTRAIRTGVPTVVPAVQEILNLRIGRYTPSRPAPDPMAETTALVFLPHPAVWPEQNQQQQLQSLALKRDLMNHLVAVAGQVDPQQRRDMLTMLSRVGSAIVAVSGDPQQATLARSAQELSRISPVTQQSDLVRIAQTVSNELQRAYPNLPPPRGGATAAGSGAATPPQPGPGGGASR